MIMILIIIMTITELIMMNRDSNIDKDEIMMIRTMTRNSNNNDDYRTANRDNDKQEACYEETRRIIRELIHLNNLTKRERKHAYHSHKAVIPLHLQSYVKSYNKSQARQDDNRSVIRKSRRATLKTLEILV